MKWYWALVLGAMLLPLIRWALAKRREHQANDEMFRHVAGSQGLEAAIDSILCPTCRGVGSELCSECRGERYIRGRRWTDRHEA